METRFETSFIPQQPLLRVEGSQRRKEPVSLALLLSLVIFFSTLAVAGGVYFFRQDADRKLTAAKLELDEREKNINIEEINALKLLSTRFEVAQRVLGEHVAFSAALDLLERSTSVNIGYSSLEFGSTNQGRNIRLLGEAPSYMSVYVQTQDLRTLPFVKDVTVSAIALSEADGIVKFTMSILLDRDLTEYVRYFDEQHRISPIVVDPTDPGFIPQVEDIPPTPPVL